MLYLSPHIFPIGVCLLCVLSRLSYIMILEQNYKGALCADTLLEQKDEFAPFCEYTDAIPIFEQYVEKVRSSAEWGGHIELRALGIALNRPIHVYSVQSGKKPLAIHEDAEDDKEPIVLSYHLHYYALGEHYNQVVVA